MLLCIFNPEHDLCLAKGRAHYVPPRSAVEFARHDAGIAAANQIVDFFKTGNKRFQVNK